MRQLWLGLFVLLSGCNDFEAALRNRCLDGGFDGVNACERFLDGGSLGGGAGGGGGGSIGGGGGGGASGGGGGSAWTLDGGPPCNENGWCWENPGGGLGAADLFALFGTTDSDVWVAGAGNTLMHWNGTRWEQARSALPPATENDSLSPERAFRTVTVSDAGEVWLSGESTRVLTGPPFVDRTSLTGFDLLTTWKGTVYGMQRGLWAMSGVSPEQRSALDFEEFHSMAFTEEGCFVSVHSSTGFTGIVNCADGGIDLDLTVSPDGGTERLMALFTLADGGLGVTGGHGNVFLRNGKGRWPELGLAGYMDLITKHNYGTLHAATRLGSEVWLTGQSGAVIKLTESLASSVVRAPDTNNPTFSTAWTSRDGTFWAAGRGGALLRIDAGTQGPAAASGPPFAVVDLWDDPQRQVAILANSDLLLRNADAGTWTRKTTFAGSDWVAGAGSGARMYLLGANGELYKWDLGQNNPTSIGTVVSGGVARSGVRSGAFGPDGSGKFLAGAGGVVALLDPLNEILTLLVPQSAPNGPSRIVGIAHLRNGRMLVAGNQGAPGAEVGGLYEVIDGGWTTVPGANITGAVEHLARCPDDTVLVVGQQELMTRYSGTAWAPLRGPTTTHVFNAAWCDQLSNAWVLSETGKVFRYSQEGQETVEVTGLGPSTGDQLEANVITGNGTTVFIGGGNSAILSRPWP